MGAGLVLILIIALVLSPIVSFGGDSDTDGSYDQVGPNYFFVDDGGDLIDSTATTGSLQTTKGGTNNKLFVDYSKEIEGTTTPNQFDITLKVKTNEDLDKIYKPSNVLIVFDVSASMDSDINVGGKRTTRWTIFRDAMAKFIDDFLSESPQNNVSIAMFGGTNSENADTSVAHGTLQTWTNSTSQAIGSFINHSRASTVRGLIKEYTNGQAGFQAAYDILKTGAYNNQYTSVVLVSDGVFNTSYDHGYSGGISTTNNTLQNDAIAEAGKVKALAGCDDIYTFAMGGDATATDNKAMRPGASNNPHLKDLLRADSDEDIAAAFQGLYDHIQSSVQPWKVIDPMSKWVDFVSGSIEIDPAQTFEIGDLAPVTNETLTWNLRNTKPEETGTAPDRVFTYTLKYTVTLDTAVVGADDMWDTLVPTNKDTLLEYAYSSNPDTTLTEHFLIPTVKAPNPVPPTGDIKISKAVTGSGAPSGDTFNFLVWKANALYNGEYYLNGSDTSSTMAGGELTLGDGDYAIIKGLTPGVEVKVQEIPKAYYKSQGGYTKTDTVVADETTVIPFTNNYSKASGLTAEKSSDPESGSIVYADEPIKYTIKVTNNDTSSTATGVVVKDFIPAQTTFSDVYNDGVYDSSDNSVKWYIDEIAPGESKEVSFEVIVEDNFNENSEDIVNIGLYKQTGEITSEGAFDNEDSFKETNEVVHIPPQPSMEISKSNTPGEGEMVGQGEDIIYQIKIQNTGNVTLNNVWVRDYIPTYTTYKDGTVSNNGTYDGAGKFVQWQIPSIGVEDSVTVSFTVVVNDDASGVTIQNVALAEILGDDTNPPTDRDPGNNTNVVTNKTPVVQGEIENPPIDDGGGSVMGEDADPVQQKVLGEEAKTSDTTNSMPYLIIMLVAAAAVMGAMMYRMSKKEQ